MTNSIKSFIESMLHVKGINNEYWQWLLENGRYFHPQPLSRQALGDIRRLHFKEEKKQCYANSQRLTVYTNARYRYYEGYAVSKTIENLGLPLPFEHGWNVVRIDEQNKMPVSVVKQDYLKTHLEVVDTTWKDDGDLYFGINIPLRFIRTNWAETGRAESMLHKFYIHHHHSILTTWSKKV